MSTNKLNLKRCDEELEYSRGAWRYFLWEDELGKSDKTDEFL